MKRNHSYLDMKVTNEGWDSAHDFGPLGLCPRAGLEVKI